MSSRPTKRASGTWLLVRCWSRTPNTPFTAFIWERHPQEKSHRRQHWSSIMDNESGRNCFFVHGTLRSLSGFINHPRLNVKMWYFQHLFWRLGIPIKHGWRLFTSIRMQGCRRHTTTSNRIYGTFPRLPGLGTQLFKQALNYTKYKTKLSIGISVTFHDG